MNFTQVVNEVMSIIKRPDKLPDVRREVNSAVNHFCMDCQPGFSFDLVEISPAIDPQALTQSILLSTFPRFRKFHYIKVGGTRTFLDVLARRELLQSSCDFSNKYYIAGQNVNISLRNLAASLDLAYFAAPPYLDDLTNNEFWMLELSPYMVIDRAASKLFTNIGDDTSANKHEGFARLAFLTAQKDYGTTTQ